MPNLFHLVSCYPCQAQFNACMAKRCFILYLCYIYPFIGIQVDSIPGFCQYCFNNMECKLLYMLIFFPLGIYPVIVFFIYLILLIVGFEEAPHLTHMGSVFYILTVQLSWELHAAFICGNVIVVIQTG